MEQIGEIEGTTVLRHDLFTNDVLYAELAFDMSSIDSKLLPLVPIILVCITFQPTLETCLDGFLEIFSDFLQSVCNGNGNQGCRLCSVKSVNRKKNGWYKYFS